ncbi:gamma-glutamylcyclotransferase family protein [Muricoccus nepalensis]|uniref:gamma-glutamylcyclotransferase family protein n=1 Tax=Muricoccus nepalensis TaxID=1854500 RepID=UPI00240E282C|nr:gamma-glutamylcyclotransferase family protein [Roseomonas nepalensis]
MPVFLYGTLLDRRTLARRSGDAALARSMRPAVLPGQARVFFRGTPYPTLLARPGARVEGALVRPSLDALAALRRYEGPCYRLCPVRVRARRGWCRARAWVVPRWMASREPWPRRA